MERFETKYDLLKRVYQDQGLKRTTKALMQYLVMKSDAVSCHPSVASIAVSLGRSDRTVQRHMRHLERAGYIVCKSRYYQQNQLTNQYEFILDIVDDLKMNIEPIGGRMKEEAYAVEEESFTMECEGGKSVRTQETHDRIEENRYMFRKMEYMKGIVCSGLSAGERNLLVYLAYKANQSGLVYGEIKNICRELHISGRLLKWILLQLRSKGYLRLKSRTSGYRQAGIIVKLVPVKRLGEESSISQKEHVDKKEAQSISQDQYSREGEAENPLQDQNSCETVEEDILQNIPQNEDEQNEKQTLYPESVKVWHKNISSFRTRLPKGIRGTLKIINRSFKTILKKLRRLLL